MQTKIELNFQKQFINTNYMQNATENIYSVGAGLRKNLSKRFVRLDFLILFHQGKRIRNMIISNPPAINEFQ
jgi:hypothetical protein